MCESIYDSVFVCQTLFNLSVFLALNLNKFFIYFKNSQILELEFNFVSSITICAFVLLLISSPCSEIRILCA